MKCKSEVIEGWLLAALPMPCGHGGAFGTLRLSAMHGLSSRRSTDIQYSHALYVVIDTNTIPYQAIRC
jgi:hypothetical protein